MSQAEDADLREIINNEFLENFNDDRDTIREIAKKQIQSVQDENQKTFNRKRKQANIYKIGDLVAPNLLYVIYIYILSVLSLKQD